MRAKRAEIRSSSRVAALEAMNIHADTDAGANPFPLGKVHVHCIFVYGTKRQIDGANTKTAMKPVFDGFTDAGLWLDDNRFVIVSESQEYRCALRGALHVEKPHAQVIITSLD